MVPLQPPKKKKKIHKAGRTNPLKLFIATIQEAFKNTQLEKKRINIDGEKLSDLRFADDLA